MFMDYRTAISWDHLRVCGADQMELRPTVAKVGSSPRVRSRRLLPHLARTPCGIISACAEQTDPYQVDYSIGGDHLRVCGADLPPVIGSVVLDGSSPRVRSRRACGRSVAAGIGIISACAEQTLCSFPPAPVMWDHLRVCGADWHTTYNDVRRLGSSPRVRSRPPSTRSREHALGIISACAEQTSIKSIEGVDVWDHLRVCGADAFDGLDDVVREGSSPRVRSRHHQGHRKRQTAGIISACAEQTHADNTGICWPRDHLRVCGADCTSLLNTVSSSGSSPRVRSRLLQKFRVHGVSGIISACAEQTPTPCMKPTWNTDHLRVCGADAVAITLMVWMTGSSPRVRSRLPGAV